MEKEITLYWSGGKDCAMALHELRTNPRYAGYRVTSLLTTMTEGYDRISGHGVRRALLEHQADCLGLDLHVAYIPQRSTMSEYEEAMEKALCELMRRGRPSPPRETSSSKSAGWRSSAGWGSGAAFR